MEVLGNIREMPMSLAKDLPYLMILGQDWTEIYQVLDLVRAQEDLIGEEEEIPPDAGGFDIQSLLTSIHFREAHEREDLFQSVHYPVRTGQVGEQVICPEHCRANPRYELRRGLLFWIKGGQLDGPEVPQLLILQAY